MSGISRRDLIKGGSAVAAAVTVGGVAAACSDDSSSTSSTSGTDASAGSAAGSTPASTAAPSTASSGADASALADMIEGQVLFPESAAYPMTAIPKNLEFRDVRPAAIVRPAGPDDVAQTIRWARGEDVKAVVYSGGHSYGGYSTTDGILIDLSTLQSIDVDESSGRVDLGGGAPLGIIDNKLAARNLTVPAGRCPTVGVAGLVLGGGFGFSARHFGLTSDSLLETQIITADGELLTVSADENPDLFWACQGGGGGNFGINVSFSFQGREVDQASVFELHWTGYDGADAIWSAAQQAAIGSPERDFSMELGIFMDNGGTSGPADNESLVMWGQYFGPEDELRDIIAPVLAAADPTSQFITGTTFAASTNQLLANTAPDAYLSKSNYLDAEIPDDGITELIDQMRQFPTEAREGEFKIFTWGGAISDVGPTDTAFVHRNDLFVNEGSGSWRLDSSQSVIDETKAWMEDTYERMSPYLIDRSYQNFIDPTLPNWAEAYYGENLARLVEVKRQYDPDDYWRFAQSIPVV